MRVPHKFTPLLRKLRREVGRAKAALLRIRHPSSLEAPPRQPGRRQFFNLDLHIGVVNDLRDVLGRQSINITDWTLSAHARIVDRVREPVAVVNEYTWRSLDMKMVRRFQTIYGDYLNQYDAFVATYPVAFSLLYEGLGPPTVAVIATRYETPFSFDRRRWAWLNEHLVTGIRSGDVILVANNRGDADYFAHYSGVEISTIPSLCAYTNATYSGRHAQALLVTRSSDLEQQAQGVVGAATLVCRSEIPPSPSWSELYSYRAIVHIPYNISVMSIFEQYSACVPLFFPTRRFLIELWRSHPDAVLAELSFGQVFGRQVDPPLRPTDDGFDPNRTSDPEVVRWWIDRADFYDVKWMPHISYFDSWDELRELLSILDPAETTDAMAAANRQRRERVKHCWEDLLRPISPRASAG